MYVGIIKSPYLLIGQQPNPGTVDHPRLWLQPDCTGIPHAGNRLLEIAGYDRARYRDTFETTNLIHHAGNWSVVEARVAAFNLTFPTPPIIGLIMVGSKVRDAWTWTLGDPGYFQWRMARAGDRSAFPCAVIPHPSGRNRLWADPETRARAREFFENLTRRSNRI